jgi:hypothetical protein
VMKPFPRNRSTEGDSRSVSLTNANMPPSQAKIGCGIAIGLTAVIGTALIWMLAGDSSAPRNNQLIGQIIAEGKLARLEIHDPELLDEVSKSPRCAALIGEICVWSHDLADSRWRRLRSLVNLASVEIYDSSNADPVLEQLRGCDHIRRISVYDTPLTSAGLKTIAAFPSLTELHLGAECLPASPEPLKGHKRLKRVWLEGLPITTEWIVVLQSLPSLELLDLLGTNVDPATLQKLRKLLPNCRMAGI